MPAEPERTVLAVIPDADDREVRVSLLCWPGRPDFPHQVEVADYVPSRDLYSRGFLFDPRHVSKVIAGLRMVRTAGMEAAAKELSAENPA